MSVKREYAVLAEPHQHGGVVTLRRGFHTRSEAEDHPVTMAHWKRVWVEKVEPDEPRKEELPPLPWDWIVAAHPTANGSFHSYIVDASGRKIMAVWGHGKEKRLIAERVIAAVNATAGKPA